MFQVKTRAVNVCNQYSNAVFCKICLASLDDEEGFATVVVIQFVAGVDFVAEGVFCISVCLCHFNGFGDGFSFGFAVVKILFVAFVVVEDFFQFFGACGFESILSFVS